MESCGKSLEERQKWWMGQFLPLFLFGVIRVIVIKNGFGMTMEKLGRDWTRFAVVFTDPFLMYFCWKSDYANLSTLITYYK